MIKRLGFIRPSQVKKMGFEIPAKFLSALRNILTIVGTLLVGFVFKDISAGEYASAVDMIFEVLSQGQSLIGLILALVSTVSGWFAASDLA